MTLISLIFDQKKWLFLCFFFHFFFTFFVIFCHFLCFFSLFWFLRNQGHFSLFSSKKSSKISFISHFWSLFGHQKSSKMRKNNVLSNFLIFLKRKWLFDHKKSLFLTFFDQKSEKSRSFSKKSHFFRLFLKSKIIMRFSKKVIFFTFFDHQKSSKSHFFWSKNDQKSHFLSLFSLFLTFFKLQKIKEIKVIFKKNKKKVKKMTKSDKKHEKSDFFCHF